MESNYVFFFFSFLLFYSLLVTKCPKMLFQIGSLLSCLQLKHWGGCGSDDGISYLLIRRTMDQYLTLPDSSSCLWCIHWNLSKCGWMLETAVSNIHECVLMKLVVKKHLLFVGLVYCCEVWRWSIKKRLYLYNFGNRLLTRRQTDARTRLHTLSLQGQNKG